MRLLFAAVIVASAVAASAEAQSLRWPFEFDPAIAEKPDLVQQQIAIGQIDLPELPLHAMKSEQVGEVRLWFTREVGEQLERMLASAAGANPWPDTGTACSHHASFVVPTLLKDDMPSGACVEADDIIRRNLADLSICRDVEEPERYAADLPPVAVDFESTGSVQGLIGIVGEALRHAPLVPAGTLPDDFVPRLRIILDKIRHDELVERLDTTRVAYLTALATALANATCFDAAAMAQLEDDVSSLVSELGAARQRLTALRQEGEQAAANEVGCLATLARSRNELPFPSLTQAEREFMAFWLGGVYWRMRGGGLIDLITTARVFFLLRPFTVLGKLAGGGDGEEAAVGIFMGAVLKGWDDWMDIGHWPGEDKYSDLVGMTDRGHFQVLEAVAQLEPHGYDTLALTAGGLQMGPCYYYSWEAIPEFRYADDMTSPYVPFIEGPTAAAEFCTGAALGLGFVRTLLYGYAEADAPSCTPSCANRACGDDGCCGSCGTCPVGTMCSSGTCLPLGDGGTCTPSCAGKSCGDNGCGGSCGACSGGASCQDSQCVAGPADDAGVSDADDGAAAKPGQGCSCRLGRGSATGGPAFMLLVVAMLWRRTRARGIKRTA